MAAVNNDLDLGHKVYDTQNRLAQVHDLDPGHGQNDDQDDIAGVQIMAPAQTEPDAQRRSDGGHGFDLGHRPPVPQALVAEVESPYPPDPIAVSKPRPAAGRAESRPPAETREGPEPGVGTPRLEDAFLLVYADALNGLESLRIATSNRARALKEKGLDETPESERLDVLVSKLKVLEDDATSLLARTMRSHPLGKWIKGQAGLGDKQVARLLAAIGDPYIDPRKNEPRTVSQLWAYCGYHVERHPGQTMSDTQLASAGVAARRRRGQRCNWNTTAKTRAYLVATSCIKWRQSPYRPVYDQRRLHTAETHPEWTAGHSHNDALRITAKAILKDLWRESRQLHHG